MKEPAIDKKFVRTSYGNIAYLETGADGKPPVLFVHGIPTSSFLWRHVLRFLQNDLLFLQSKLELGQCGIPSDRWKRCPYRLSLHQDFGGLRLSGLQSLCRCRSDLPSLFL